MKVAEVFSDPPINFVHADVGEGEAQLRIGLRFPLSGHLADLPPGPYTFGIRSHHFSIHRRTDADIEIASTVELAEINGSQTFVHFHYRNRSLVLEEEGVHTYRGGSLIHVYVQPRHFYVFDEAGRLMRSPALD
jgi:glycerol transport system ATP-binding protein